MQCVSDNIVIEGEKKKKTQGGNWFYLRNWLDHKKYAFHMRMEHVSEFAVNSEKAFWLFKVRFTLENRSRHPNRSIYDNS